MEKAKKDIKNNPMISLKEKSKLLEKLKEIEKEINVEETMSRIRVAPRDIKEKIYYFTEPGKKDLKYLPFKRQWKNLNQEEREKVICSTIDEKNIFEIFDILGKDIKKCKSIKKLNWRKISEQRKLNDNFIREFQDFIYWEDLTSISGVKPSIKFIKEFKKHFNDQCWFNLCQYQILEEDVIRKFEDELDEECWEEIFETQKLSKSFKQEFAYKLE